MTKTGILITGIILHILHIISVQLVYEKYDEKNI